MQYACRTLQTNTPPATLEAMLNRAALQGWTCISVVSRTSDLLIVFGGEFSNLGAFAVGSQLLDSALAGV